MANDTLPVADDATGRRRATSLGIGLRIVVLLLGLLVAAWLILFVTKGRFLRPTFEAFASRVAGREVKVAGDFQLYLYPLDIRFLADRMTIANPRWATRPNFVSARHIETRIATFPLLFGKRRMRWLILADGDVDLEWDAAGRRNSWTFGNKPGAPLDLPAIERATVTGTRLHYRDPKMRFVADLAFQTIKAADTRVAGAVRFSGGGTLRARPFTLAGTLLSPNQTVAGGRNRLELHARSDGNSLDVAGTLPAATRIEGADLVVTARGPNLANLFDFLGVAVPPTRAYAFTSHLTKESGAWKFTRLSGHFGDSDLAGRMTLTFPAQRLRIDADLASRSVDIVDVGPFIGYDPERLAKEGAKGAVTRVGGVPRILPDARLRSEAIAGFDAHVLYAVKTIRAPHLPVSNISLTLDLDRSRLALSPLTMDVARGHLASDILIDARRRPAVTEYDIRLAPTPMSLLLSGFGVEEAGTTGIVKARIKLRGTGDTVHDSLATANGRIAAILPRGTLWTRNVQLAELDIGTFFTKLLGRKLKKPVEINCGLLAFTVRDGVAAADPILIDTSRNVIAGRGGFSFKDESLALAIRADAKTFSLFSAQSPVGINGHFAAPGLRIISPQLLARGGVGIALGLVNPFAAVLAFVDIGDAKSAACGPVLAGAVAARQRTTKNEPRKDVGKGASKP
jgi:uncharacterized protein involved in outer membrane biogenesis